jgi:acetylornithine deacetylase/succinyl-diaminopimelate desuccinylase-like protein
VTDYKPIDEYLEKHIDDSIGELSKLAAQPSVGAQNWGMAECASLVSELLKARGFSVEIQPTAGAPVVFGEKKGKTNKTLLFYNHYDVQPPDPWSFGNSSVRTQLAGRKLFRQGQ